MLWLERLEAGSKKVEVCKFKKKLACYYYILCLLLVASNFSLSLLEYLLHTGKYY
jgi:hypothetical protein